MAQSGPVRIKSTYKDKQKEAKKGKNRQRGKDRPRQNKTDQADFAASSFSSWFNFPVDFNDNYNQYIYLQ